MKILGDSPIRKRTIKVLIGKNERGEAVELEVRAVKFGTMMEIERDIPKPMAPSTGAKKLDPKTKQPLKRNGQYVMLRDEDDEDYLQALDIRQTAINVAIIIASLGEQLSDVRVKSAEMSPSQHWLAVLDDLADAGIDPGIFQSLVAAALQLSEPLTSIELLLMRQALGTDKETDASTDEKDKEAIEHAAKALESGKV